MQASIRETRGTFYMICGIWACTVFVKWAPDVVCGQTRLHQVISTHVLCLGWNSPTRDHVLPCRVTMFCHVLPHDHVLPCHVTMFCHAVWPCSATPRDHVLPRRVTMFCHAVWPCSATPRDHVLPRRVTMFCHAAADWFHTAASVS